MLLRGLIYQVGSVTPPSGRGHAGSWGAVKRPPRAAGGWPRDLPECRWPERLVTLWRSLGTTQSPLPPRSSLLQLPKRCFLRAASSSPILDWRKPKCLATSSAQEEFSRELKIDASCGLSPASCCTCFTVARGLKAKLNWPCVSLHEDWSDTQQ